MSYKTLPLLLLFLISCTGREQESFSKNNMEFPEKLSQLGLFKGKMKNLVPNDNIQELTLSSTLFTDYTEKQRLIKLPSGTKMTAKDDNLPGFPDGTILAKTFYYSAAQTQTARQILETRILQKNKGVWNVSTYQWNEEQTEAFLISNGTTVKTTIKLPDGHLKDIKYKIPTVYDCYDCHRNKNELTPIGPKLRNLNINILVEGKLLPQLNYLEHKGFLNLNKEPILPLPNYKDKSFPLEQRARAYFEMNCAHCHNPNGFAGGYSLNLDFSTPFKNTGITFNKWNIEHRMTIRDMPRLGTTVIDEEGLKLITDYLKSLDKK